MKTIAWKLSLWRRNSFIVLCMYALSLSSKFLIEKKHFPTFLITQIDQSSPADFVLHRPWKAPKRGVKISLILISSETSVAVKFLPWEKKKKKKIKLYMTTNFWSFIPAKFPCICWMKRCSCYCYPSQWKAKLYIAFLIARVPSSLVAA